MMSCPIKKIDVEFKPTHTHTLLSRSIEIIKCYHVLCCIFEFIVCENKGNDEVYCVHDIWRIDIEKTVFIQSNVHSVSLLMFFVVCWDLLI